MELEIYAFINDMEQKLAERKAADDVHNFCYIVENDYCSGIMWAMKKDDGGMTLEISMVKQILEDRHKSIC